VPADHVVPPAAVVDQPGVRDPAHPARLGPPGPPPALARRPDLPARMARPLRPHDGHPSRVGRCRGVTITSDADPGTRAATQPTVDFPPQPTVAERREVGRAARKAVPRSSHAGWKPPADRADPVDLLEAQNADRLSFLAPVRRGRMSASPF